MPKPSVLISGASIAGLSAAYWLSQLGWKVTIIERAPAFRTGGQNVDIRGVARDVLRKMELFDAAKQHNTTEEGTIIVDGHGKTIATLPSDDADGATAELEILRGDLAQIIYKALAGGVKLVYGDVIKTVDQKPKAVSIKTESGKDYDADLLIIAEGVRSSTRKLVFANADVQELGITMAFGTIPRVKDDIDYWRWYNTTGGRQIHLRPDNHGTTRAILAYAEGKRLAHVGTKEALSYLDETFQDAGWQAERVLAAFKKSDDMYVDDLAQVHMPTWHDGRVVLIGDAAWCVTPIGGGGASLALTAGYVLAAYLSQHATPKRSATGLDQLESALQQYETWMRPLVTKVQKLPPGIKATAYPQSRFGLAMRNVLNKIIFSSVLKPLSSKMSHVADTDQHLPALRMQS